MRSEELERLAEWLRERMWNSNGEEFCNFRNASIAVGVMAKQKAYAETAAEAEIDWTRGVGQ